MKKTPVWVDTLVPVPIAGFAVVFINCIVNGVTEFDRFSPGVNRIGVVAPAVPAVVFVYST